MENQMIVVDSIVEYDIGAAEGQVFQITDELPDSSFIPKKSNVVITGRSAIWRYVMAFDEVLGKKPNFVACYDPRIGNVVVFPEKDRGKLLEKSVQK